MGSEGLNIGTLWAHIGLDTKPLALGKAEAQGIFNSMGLSAGALKAQLAGLAVAVAGGLGFKAMIQTGIRFDNAMTQAKATMRATREEADRMQAAVFGMRVPTKAADAMKSLAIRGKNATDAIAMMPVVTDYMKAHVMDAAAAVDDLDAGLDAFHLKATDSRRVADVFTRGVQGSTANIQEFVGAMKMAGPTAYALGYSLEETGGMVMALAEAGIDGERAGSNLAMSMKRANDVAVKYKLTNRDLVSVLDWMNKTGKSSQDILDGFGMRSGVAALALGRMTDKTRDFQKELLGASGATKTLADEMRGTLGTAWDMLKGRVEKISLKVFLRFKDSLSGMVLGVKRWFDAHADSIVSFLTLIGRTAETVLRVMGPVLDALETFGETLAKVFLTSHREADEAVRSMKKVGREADTAGVKMSDWWRATKLMEGPPKLSGWQKFFGTIAKESKNALMMLGALGTSIWTVVLETLQRTVKGLFALLASVSYLLAGITTYKQGNYGATLEYMRGFQKFMKDLGNEWLPPAAVGEFFSKQFPIIAREWGSKMDFRGVGQKHYDEWYQGIQDEYLKMKGGIAGLEIGAIVGTDFRSLGADAGMEFVRGWGIEVPGRLHAGGFKQTRFDLQSYLESLGTMEGPSQASETLKSAWSPIPAGTEYLHGRGTFEPYKRVTPSKSDVDAELEKVKNLHLAIAQGWKDILSAGRFAESGAEDIWAKHAAAQAQVIEDQRNADIASGMDKDLANKFAEKKLKDLEDEHAAFIRNEPLIRAQVSLYQDLISSGTLSASELKNAWADYTAWRLKEIASEADALGKLRGWTEDQTKAFMKMKEAGIPKEKEQFYAGQRDTLLAGWRDVLQANNLSKQEMQALWADVEELTTAQIDAQVQQMKDAAAALGVVFDAQAVRASKIRQFKDEQLEASGRTWLAWSRNLGGHMHDLFSETFFSAMKRDFQDFGDFLKSLWDSILREISDSLAQAVTDWIREMARAKAETSSGWIWKILGMIGGGGGGGGGGLPYEPEFMAAKGGIVTGPRMGLVGEAGPEAIIPLAKFREPEFMAALTGRARARGQEDESNGRNGPMIVMHVHTPDARSFQESQTQILSRALVTLRQAERRAG